MAEWEMDYEDAAGYWTKKEQDMVHMETAALKEKIDAFIKEHNTCALACAAGDFVRCTPIEYNYVDDCFFLFSEGGFKFKALKENKNVALSIFEPFTDFSRIKGLQVTAKAEIVEPFSADYMKLLEHKKIRPEYMKQLPKPMTLLKIIPESFDLLDSDLKKEGYGNRQHLQVK